MSLSCVVPGNFQSFTAGVVCEDKIVEANEFNPLDSCVFHNFCIKIKLNFNSAEALHPVANMGTARKILHGIFSP